MRIYPNPNNGQLKIAFNLKTLDDVTLTIHDLKGSVVNTTLLTNLMIGENIFEKEVQQLNHDSVYLISLETKNRKSTHKLVIKK
ncbi:hypothetical protein JCM19297_1393 [Nonlabens ulvanivorans]|nr:T9SS type A sorting domain-containing protein [Nonlabens ulvanivorans]GAK89565.1 hypothetical protein JCM19297_1393 [Nonlabens ulvanivorans]